MSITFPRGVKVTIIGTSAFALTACVHGAYLQQMPIKTPDGKSTGLIGGVYLRGQGPFGPKYYQVYNPETKEVETRTEEGRVTEEGNVKISAPPMEPSLAGRTATIMESYTDNEGKEHKKRSTGEIVTYEGDPRMKKGPIQEEPVLPAPESEPTPEITTTTITRTFKGGVTNVTAPSAMEQIGTFVGNAGQGVGAAMMGGAAVAGQLKPETNIDNSSNSQSSSNQTQYQKGGDTDVKIKNTLKNKNISNNTNCNANTNTNANTNINKYNRNKGPNQGCAPF